MLVHGNNGRPSADVHHDESVLAAAINNLVVQVKDHVVNTEKRFEDVSDALAAIGGQPQRSNFRFRGGNFNNNRRGNRGGRYNNSNNSRRGNFNQYNGRGRGRGSAGSSGSSAITCYNCGKANHYAWGCTLPPGSENYWGRHQIYPGLVKPRGVLQVVRVEIALSWEYQAMNHWIILYKYQIQTH